MKEPWICELFYSGFVCELKKEALSLHRFKRKALLEKEVLERWQSGRLRRS